MPTIFRSTTESDIREGSHPPGRGFSPSLCNVQQLLPHQHPQLIPEQQLQQQQQQQQAKETCFGCQRPIEDRFLLRVMENSWHERCLHCSICLEPLRQSCFIKDRRLLCRLDYDKLYGVRCGGCSQTILSNELVMRALGNVYHVTCFACAVCHHQLQKGDQFVANESEIYCRLDFEKKCASFMQLSPKSADWYHTKSDDDSSLDDNDHPKGPKRPRTILTTSQRRKFKASFEVNPKPCRKVRETLAAETGLSVRVVQVWFQNQRAKMKKLARRQSEDNGQQTPEKGKKHGKNKLRKDEDASDSSVPPSDGGSNLTVLVTCSENKHYSASDNQLTPFSNHSSQDLYNTSNSAASDPVYNSTTTTMPLDTAVTGLDSCLDDLLLTSGHHHHHHHHHGPPLPAAGNGSSGTGHIHQGPAAVIINPIDKLYSMQNSYFSVD